MSNDGGLKKGFLDNPCEPEESIVIHTGASREFISDLFYMTYL